MSSSFGHSFRITTFGESHGVGVGVVIDGCPPNVEISDSEIQLELDRRRPGQSKIVTQRKESDTVEILSGVLNGRTLGSPIALLVRNENQRSQDYDTFEKVYRPSHADFAYDQKYGIRSVAGGGRSSARETIGRVAAGALAKKILSGIGVEIIGYVERVHSIQAHVDPETVTLAAVESNPVRCPDPEAAAKMIQFIEDVRKQGESVGGVVGACARGVPAGWGEPIFDKLEADLAKAMLSIPACKGFESGDGFTGTYLTGSEHNDLFVSDETGKIRTQTNRSGGIQGGISNGMPITIKAAFKPTATIVKTQSTVTVTGEPSEIVGKGRHDPCVLPRAVPIVEAMFALVLVDHFLRQRGLVGA